MTSNIQSRKPLLDFWDSDWFKSKKFQVFQQNKVEVVIRGAEVGAGKAASVALDLG